MMRLCHVSVRTSQVCITQSSRALFKAKHITQANHLQLQRFWRLCLPLVNTRHSACLIFSSRFFAVSKKARKHVHV